MRGNIDYINTIICIYMQRFTHFYSIIMPNFREIFLINVTSCRPFCILVAIFDFYLYMNHKCLKLDINMQYYAKFPDCLMIYTIFTAISHKVVNNGGHYGFWRPF